MFGRQQSNGSGEEIQLLLRAEQEAAEIVSQARKDKVAKLKMAREEAEVEVAQYRASLESQFKQFCDEKKGNKGSYVEELKQKTKIDVSEVENQVRDKKADVIDILLNAVYAVNVEESAKGLRRI